MKKTAIALAIAGLAAATVAQAAPQANTFYAGAKAGWASVHHDLNQFKGKPGQTVSRNSEAYGVFGGYQITDNLAVEAGYEYFGRAKTKTNGEQYFRHTAHGTTLALKGSYPVLADLDVYGRVGAALIRSDYKINVGNDVEKFHNLKVSPVFAAGVEYAILPELALRAEYQWVSRVGNLGKAQNKANKARTTEYSPDIGSVSLGLSYRFGQGAAPAPAPEVVSRTFNLNSDVTFAFGKADLKPQAQGVLDGIYGEIAQVKSANVKVAGYTDRIGSDAYNQKLSQKRAETVANYLVAKGVPQNDISATGYGEANPVTGTKCDAVKGRKALIACLADDRRVEIAVSGTK